MPLIQVAISSTCMLFSSRTGTEIILTKFLTKIPTMKKKEQKRANLWENNFKKTNYFAFTNTPLIHPNLAAVLVVTCWCSASGRPSSGVGGCGRKRKKSEHLCLNVIFKEGIWIPNRWRNILHSYCNVL